ncbi:MAG: serine/threonine-protein kinase [Candidatus Melainabacteria bacterium]|nr:serine/threonine-protein kinase [Candidatus Melainabacteria bacterium]
MTVIRGDIKKETIPEDILAVLGERYVGIQYLSAGAAGAVFRAHDTDLDKKVAIKVLKSSSDRDLIAFQNEARAAAQLEHMNLVSTLNFGITANNNAYIILEFVDGLSLERFVDSNGRLPILQTVNLLQQIVSGLAHAHSKKIAHRDLKTSNIMIYGFGTSSLKAVIIDFGLASNQKLQDESQLASNAIFGSPLYMSPEQASGSKGDHRSDIYGLGCIAYRMITGSPPFDTDDLFTLLQMHREDDPPLLAELLPDVEIPDGLQECLDIMLQKDPDDRFQNVEEIGARLKAIEIGLIKEAEEELEELISAKKETAEAPKLPLLKSRKNGSRLLHCQCCSFWSLRQLKLLQSLCGDKLRHQWWWLPFWEFWKEGEIQTPQNSKTIGESRSQRSWKNTSGIKSFQEIEPTSTIPALC